MNILALRTDKPQAEAFLYENTARRAQITWEAHRQLADTIHIKIDELLNNCGLTLNDLNAAVCFKGPGSFTGLRIGATVINALGYALNIPIIGSSEDDWQAVGIQKLLAGEKEKIIIPEYGSNANITLPKK